MALLRSATKGHAVLALQSTTCGTPDERAGLPKDTAAKPRGGQVFITVVQLCLLWWAYRVVRCLDLQDLRVWYAAQLLVASRPAGQQPRYTEAEILKLLGWRSGRHHVRSSLDRLEHFGLLTWTTTEITFARSPADLWHIDDFTSFYRLLARIANNGRSIPVPRQMLRCLVRKELRAILLATMLGHLLHCLYWSPRQGGCSTGGWCNPAWIAEVFGVDHRHVKRARQRLVALGWLTLGPSRKGLGTWARINLTWTRAGLRDADQRCSDVQEKTARQRPPQPASPARQRPPLLSDPSFPLKKETKKPDPPQANPAGSGIGHATEEKPKLSLATRHFSRESLQDDAALDKICNDGVEEGWWTKAKRDRLQVYTLAEHALRTAKDPQNPGAQFAENLRHKRWYGNDHDEAAAEARLIAYERRSAPPQATDREPPFLSPDARFVEDVLQKLPADWRDRPFLAVKLVYPEWTRARWDTAASELAAYQRVWKANRLAPIGDLGRDTDWRASPCPEDLTCAECGEVGPACACQDVEDLADGEL
jgi:hypothetical protein